MASAITHHLRANVYPRLDAVAAQLFDAFSPRNEGDQYLLECPHCHQPTAYYRAGNDSVLCDACKRKTSVWDMVEATGCKRSEIPKLLSMAAGVELPQRNNERRNEETASPTQGVQQPTKSKGPTALTTIQLILRESLTKSDIARNYLIERRGWSEEEVLRAPIGYYPSSRIIMDRLQQSGLSSEEIGASSVISAEFEQQICGWWGQPDGTYKLWTLGFSATEERGMRLQKGLKTDRPCYWEEAQKYNPVILVADPLDAARLHANNIGAVALGAGQITTEQAPYLATQQTRLIYWSSPDGAGQGGAEKSVLKLSILGKPIDCFNAPEAWGRPEQALSAVGEAVVCQTICEATLTGGTFLAKRIGAQLGRVDMEKTYLKGRIWKRILTSRTRDEFDAELGRQGMSIGHDVAEALRSAAALIDTGIDLTTVCEIVQRRYSVVLTVSDKVNQNV